jgi:hypothetical protein
LFRKRKKIDILKSSFGPRKKNTILEENKKGVFLDMEKHWKFGKTI